MKLTTKEQLKTAMTKVKAKMADMATAFASDIDALNRSKAGTATATTSANGLMSATDKAKLDGVAEGANKYTHPSTHAASMITPSATRRFVSDTEKETWNGKQDKSSSVDITIPITGWSSDSTATYPKYYDIAVTGVTASDRADVLISPAGMATAAACELCSVSETLDGKIRIRAASVPTASIAAQYWIEKGA